jgi:hypothetical protein
VATTNTKLDGLADASADPPVTIVLDPHRPGIQRARLLEHNVPIWPLIAFMTDVDDEAEVERIASDYNVPPYAVRAAVAFYREHQAAFDALIDTLRLAAESTYPTGIIR